MATLEILTIPDPRLKSKSLDVDSFDSNLKKTINNMFETLYSTGNGIGLAAPQVGILKRIVVIDLKKDGNLSPLTFVMLTVGLGFLSVHGSSVARFKTVKLELVHHLLISPEFAIAQF